MPHGELIQSVLRAVNLLELVAHSERGLSLGEVCTALGLKQPTAHNLMRTLASRGLVEKTSSPVRYRLGPAVLALAGEYSTHNLIRRAEAVLGECFGELRAFLPAQLGPEQEAALSFSQYVGGEIVMMLRVRAQRPNVIERPRMTFGAYSSAASLVFQAYWNPEEQRRYARLHPFQETGASLWKSEEKFLAFLQTVRETGYCIPTIFAAGQTRMAAPVFGAGHELVGAVGLGIWTVSSPPRRKLVSIMLNAAERIGKVDTAPRISTSSTELAVAT
jgi:DNA-binding IclR family transcriptional regulator